MYIILVAIHLVMLLQKAYSKFSFEFSIDCIKIDRHKYLTALKVFKNLQIAFLKKVVCPGNNLSLKTPLVVIDLVFRFCYVLLPD